MASAVTICNGALLRLGARRISSLGENTVEGKLCVELYEQERKDLLRSHPWRFAVKWAEPATIADPPTQKYDFVYAVPGDCLRIIGTSVSEDQWVVEGDYISADIEDLQIRYIRDVTDVNQMDDNFVKLFQLKMAVAMCYALTSNATLRDSIEREYERNLRTSRSFSAQESSPDRVYADNWLNARRS